jgi:hypothetical protein
MRTFLLAFAVAAIAGVVVGHRSAYVAGVECAVDETGITCDSPCDCGAGVALDELNPIGTAYAGPVWSAKMVSADAGSTQTVQLTAKRCYCVQPTTDATCMHLDTWDGGSLAADCTKDLGLDSTAFQTNSMAPGFPNRGRLFCFDSAQQTAVVLMQTDGGAVNANLFNEYANPVGPNYVCSTPVNDRMN